MSLRSPRTPAFLRQPAAIACCSGCGNTKARYDDGYSTCCNEPQGTVREWQRDNRDN